MSSASIVSALTSLPAGRLFTITVKRDAKVLKTAPAGIEKVSRLTLQNCRYAARTPVKEGIANGDRDEPSLPPAVKSIFWEDGKKAYLGEGKEGKRYLCAPLHQTVDTVWLFKGNEVSFDFVEPFLQASEKAVRKSKEELAEIAQVPFLTVNVDNVVGISV